jgi:hypothetical protein
MPAPSVCPAPLMDDRRADHGQFAYRTWRVAVAVVGFVFWVCPQSTGNLRTIQSFKGKEL